MARLQGKVALITGAAVGIGYAIAEAYLTEGASVVITDIDGQALEAASTKLGHPDQLRTVQANAAVATDWEKAVSVAEKEFGGLDILVNNAGIEVLGTAETVDESTWDRIMAIKRSVSRRACRTSAAAQASRQHCQYRLYRRSDRRTRLDRLHQQQTRAGGHDQVPRAGLRA
jgi:3-oxoacyl-[acyl-carrier protein] reductase